MLDMASMIRKIPELRSNAGRQGKLEYRNEPIAKILVDDKENGLISASRQYPMHFIPASYLSRIELILPHSPEFNNELPILLIHLKRALPYGVAAELAADADTKNHDHASADLVANTPYIGVGVNYRFGFSGEPALETRNNRTAAGTGQITGTQRISRSISRSHRAGLDLFRPVLKNRFDLLATLKTTYRNADAWSQTESFLQEIAAGKQTTSGFSRQRATDSPLDLNAGLSLSRKWGRNNKIALKYTFAKADESGRERLTDQSMERPSGREITTSAGRREHRAEVSLTMRDPSRQYRWGLTSQAGFYDRTYSNLTENYLTTGTADSHRTALPEWDNGLDYRQRVLYLRPVLLGKIYKEIVGYSVAFRAEHVWNKGMYSSTIQTPFEWSESRILPEAGLSFFRNGHRLSASYGISVLRPSASQLNPYVNYADPLNLSSGNPALRGERTGTWMMNYTKSFTSKWLNNISLNGTYGRTRNAIERIVTLGEDGVTLSTYANLGRREALSLTGMVYLRPMPDLRVSLGGGYNRSVYSLPAGSRNEMSFFHGNLNTDYSTGSWSFSSLFSLEPSIRAAQAVAFRMQPTWDVQCSKLFEKQHCGITLSAEDILHGATPYYYSLSGSGFVSEHWIQRLGRTFRLSIFWQIGRFKKPETVSIKAYDQ